MDKIVYCEFTLAELCQIHNYILSIKLYDKNLIRKIDREIDNKVIGYIQDEV